MQILPAILIAAALSNGPAADPAHDLELRAFGGTLAIILVASTHCPDILINKPLVGHLARQAHFAKGQDGPAVDAATHASVAVFTAALVEAPSPQAWCDAVYRLYGPSGKIVPDLMRRGPPDETIGCPRGLAGQYYQNRTT